MPDPTPADPDSAPRRPFEDLEEIPVLDGGEPTVLEIPDELPATVTPLAAAAQPPAAAAPPPRTPTPAPPPTAAVPPPVAVAPAPRPPVRPAGGAGSSPGLRPATGTAPAARPPAGAAPGGATGTGALRRAGTGRVAPRRPLGGETASAADAGTGSPAAPRRAPSEDEIERALQAAGGAETTDAVRPRRAPAAVDEIQEVGDDAAAGSGRLDTDYDRDDVYTFTHSGLQMQRGGLPILFVLAALAVLACAGLYARIYWHGDRPAPSLEEVKAMFSGKTE